MSSKISIAALIIHGALLGFVANANAACSVPVVLSNGTPADANQVMQNFNELAACAMPSTNPTFSGTVFGPDGSTWNSSGIHMAPSLGYTQDNTLAFRIENNEVSLNGNSAGNLTLQGDGSGRNSIVINNASSQTAIGFWGGVLRMVLLSNGYLGVGTDSPGYLLTVNGTAYALGAAGALSDVRHKTDIASLSDGIIDKVMRLRPITFHWKEPKDDGMRGSKWASLLKMSKRYSPPSC